MYHLHPCYVMLIPSPLTHRTITTLTTDKQLMQTPLPLSTADLHQHRRGGCIGESLSIPWHLQWWLCGWVSWKGDIRAATTHLCHCWLSLPWHEEAAERLLYCHFRWEKVIVCSMYVCIHTHVDFVSVYMYIYIYMYLCAHFVHVHVLSSLLKQLYTACCCQLYMYPGLLLTTEIESLWLSGERRPLPSRIQPTQLSCLGDSVDRASA